MTTVQDGGRVFSLTHRPPLPQEMLLVLVSVRIRYSNFSSFLVMKLSITICCCELSKCQDLLIVTYVVLRRNTSVHRSLRWSTVIGLGIAGIQEIK